MFAKMTSVPRWLPKFNNCSCCNKQASKRAWIACMYRLISKLSPQDPGKEVTVWNQCKSKLLLAKMIFDVQPHYNSLRISFKPNFDDCFHYTTNFSFHAPDSWNQTLHVGLAPRVWFWDYMIKASRVSVSTHPARPHNVLHPSKHKTLSMLGFSVM